MEIRYATKQDLDALSALEALCFPPAEAATRESFARRLQYYPNHFWTLWEDDQLLSFVNGMATDQRNLTDEMYDQAALHQEDGAWQMIFGVNTHPAFRRQGYAEILLQRAISDAKLLGRKGLVLTCKEALLHYYSKFGFVNEGISQSTHGDVTWYQMRLTF